MGVSGREVQRERDSLRLLPSAAHYAKLVPGFISAVYRRVRDSEDVSVCECVCEWLRVSLAALQLEQGT